MLTAHGRDKPCPNKPEQRVDVINWLTVLSIHKVKVRVGVNVMEHFKNKRIFIRRIFLKCQVISLGLGIG